MLNTLDDILPKLNRAKKIALIYGNFNVIHHGHSRLLKFAHENADCVIIGLFNDNHAGVMVELEKRYTNVYYNSYIDYLFVIDDNNVLKTLDTLRPNIVVKGEEHIHSSQKEMDIIESYGGKILFASGNMSLEGFERSQLRYDNQLSKFDYQPSFQERHHISTDLLKNSIEKFSDLNALIIGDVIIDEYVDCNALGMSREDPTLVVLPINKNIFIGGAGIVAAHIKSLNVNTEFITITGCDDNKDFVLDMLNEYGVKTHLFLDETRPTTKKVRYRAQNKTLLRVNELKQHTIPYDIGQDIINKAKKLLPTKDILFLSDFNYGCLPNWLINTLIDICKEYDVKIVADSQSSSQIGDISRFHDCMLLTPTEYEARLALSDQDSSLTVLAESLITKTNAQNIIITLGEDGAFGHSQISSESFKTDEINAMNNYPVDVSGAGDCLFVLSSLSLLTGLNLWHSLFLGSLAASIQTDTLGNIPITSEKILIKLDSLS